jgi:flavodoxin
VKPLVVFYSRTGTTKKVGEALADLLQCDREELIDTKKRTGPLSFLRSGRDAARNKLTVLEPLIHDPALYDVVALGTPVWSGLMSSPMRTYITINKSKFNRVAFFCTQGGNENKKLFDDMQALCGRRPVSVLALRAAVVKNEEYEERLRQFAGVLQMQSDANAATTSEDR